jgi:hypothetical protein
MGMLSLAIGLLVGLGEIVLVVIAGIMATKNPGGLNENSPEAIVVGLGILGGLAVDLLGGILALAGLFEQRKSKLFPVLGLIVCSMVILGIGLLMAIGLMAA